MNPEIAKYTARIESYIEGKDPIAVQRQTPATLEELVKNQPDGVLDRERAPGKWTVRDILAHLLDVEIATSWRYRQIIERSGVPLTAFDQDEWSRLGEYGVTDINESLAAFRILRHKNLVMFKRLTPEEWKRFGVHAERGELTVEILVRQIAGHDLNHIEQIREILNQH